MGRTSTTWELGSTWYSGKTTSIRVPIALKNEILDYARAVDSNLKIDNNSEKIPVLIGDFLQIIDRYIEHERQNYHPNQNARILDTNTRAWDKLRKLQLMLRESPELLFQD